MQQHIPQFLPDCNQIEYTEERILNQNSLYLDKREDVLKQVKQIKDIFSLILINQQEDLKYNLQKKCLKLLCTLIRKKKLTAKLYCFYNNQQILNDFIQFQNSNFFDDINFELISLILKSKIIIYKIKKGSLYSQIYNNQYKNTINLFKSQQQVYSNIVTEYDFQFITNIINDIVDSLFIKNQKFKNIRKNSYDTIDKHINQFLNESDESSDLLAESIANSDLFFNKKNPYNVYNKDSIEQMNKPVKFQQQVQQQTKNQVFTVQSFQKFDNQSKQKTSDSSVRIEHESKIKSKCNIKSIMCAKNNKSNFSQVQRQKSNNNVDFQIKPDFEDDQSEFMMDRLEEDSKEEDFKKPQIQNFQNAQNNYIMQKNSQPFQFKSEQNINYANYQNQDSFLNQKIQNPNQFEIVNPPYFQIQDKSLKSMSYIGEGIMNQQILNMSFQQIDMNPQFQQIKTEQNIKFQSQIENRQKKNLQYKSKHQDLEVIQEVPPQIQLPKTCQQQDHMIGFLKFYDDEKKFGFIGISDNQNDIFFHYDDIIQPVGISSGQLKQIRLNKLVQWEFKVMSYFGKYKNSLKAVEIIINFEQVM